MERWGGIVATGWRRFPALAAGVLNAAVGWGDELVQGVLPNRVYDLRDVLLNAIAGALVVTVAATAAGCGRGRRRWRWPNPPGSRAAAPVQRRSA